MIILKIRKLFFFGLIILGLVSCGTPDEITLPNEKLKVKDKVVIYKKTPYTGKLLIPLSPKGNTGTISLVNGFLDGVSELKNEKDGFLLRYNVSGKKFHGEIIYKGKEGELTLNTNQGKITTIKLINLVSNSKYDFTFKDGLASGTFENKERKLNFVNGTALVSDKDGIKKESKFSIDQNTWTIKIEDIINGEVKSKYEEPLDFSPKTLEETLFSVIK